MIHLYFIISTQTNTHTFILSAIISSWYNACSFIILAIVLIPILVWNIPITSRGTGSVIIEEIGVSVITGGHVNEEGMTDWRISTEIGD